MSDRPSFPGGLFRSAIRRRDAVALVMAALTWSSLAFCGEINVAAQNGDLKKVKSLLKANPDLVFTKDTSGHTPLHEAAYNGHNQVVELLLASKADINAKDGRGYTALYLAVMNNHRTPWNCCWPIRPISMPGTT